MEATIMATVAWIVASMLSDAAKGSCSRSPPPDTLAPGSGHARHSVWVISCAQPARHARSAISGSILERKRIHRNDRKRAHGPWDALQAHALLCTAHEHCAACCATCRHHGRSHLASQHAQHAHNTSSLALVTHTSPQLPGVRVPSVHRGMCKAHDTLCLFTFRSAAQHASLQRTAVGV